MKCELLRHRRIWPSEKLIEVNDQCLSKAYQKLGYNHGQIFNIKKNCLKTYKSKYDEAFNLITGRKIPRTVLCGTTTVYEGFHNTHKIMKELFKTSKIEESAKLPIIVPGLKLKRYLFTKRNYLVRQRKFIETNK